MWSGSEVVVVGGGGGGVTEMIHRSETVSQGKDFSEMNWKKLVLLICSSSFFNTETKVDEGRRSCCSSSETTLNV